MSGRRDFLAAAGTLAGALGAGVLPRPSSATPAAASEAIAKLVGAAKVQQGKVAIELPPLVDNGNVVALGIAVDSPMTEADHVVSVHVFAERNPQPYVIGVRLGPRAGRARIATRIRLADTQTVTAIAQLSDGSFWGATRDVVVTTAACAEELS